MAAHPKGFFKDVGGWIKRHPLASALIAIVAGVLVYTIITNSQSQTGSSTGTGTAVSPNVYPDIYIIGSLGSPSPNNPSSAGNPGVPIVPSPKPTGNPGLPVKKKHPKPTKGSTPTVHHPKAHGHDPHNEPINIVVAGKGTAHKWNPTKQGPHPR